MQLINYINISTTPTREVYNNVVIQLQHISGLIGQKGSAQFHKTIV